MRDVQQSPKTKPAALARLAQPRPPHVLHADAQQTPEFSMPRMLFEHVPAVEGTVGGEVVGTGVGAGSERKGRVTNDS